MITDPTRHLLRHLRRLDQEADWAYATASRANINSFVLSADSALDF